MPRSVLQYDGAAVHPSIANRRKKVGKVRISELESAIRGDLRTILDADQGHEILNSMYCDGINHAIASVESSDPATPEGQEIRKTVAEYMNRINAACKVILENREEYISTPASRTVICLPA